MDNKINPFQPPIQPNIPPGGVPAKPIKTPMPPKVNDLKQTENEENPEINNSFGGEENNSLNGLFQLPPHQVVKRLSSALQKYANDPKLEKLLLEFKISPHGKQAIAFCTFACLQDLIGHKLKLTPDEEKNILEALKNEYEKDSSKEVIDPDERKKRKKERKKKNKPKVNALLSLIDECISKLPSKNLDSEGSSLNINT